MIGEAGYGSKPVKTSNQNFAKDVYMRGGAIKIKQN